MKGNAGAEITAQRVRGLREEVPAVERVIHAQASQKKRLAGEGGPVQSKGDVEFNRRRKEARDGSRERLMTRDCSSDKNLCQITADEAGEKREGDVSARRPIEDDSGREDPFSIIQ